MFEIFNLRFWWFCFLVFSPCIAGIIGCIIEGIREARENG